MRRCLLAATLVAGCGGAYASKATPANGVGSEAPAIEPRNVDWRNFMYQRDGDVVRYRLRDGRAVGPTPDAGTLHVRDVAFGDLTGDGVDEAVVLLELLDAGPDAYDWATVFTRGLEPGTAPTQLGTIEGGDPADGRILEIDIYTSTTPPRGSIDSGPPRPPSNNGALPSTGSPTWAPGRAWFPERRAAKPPTSTSPR